MKKYFIWEDNVKKWIKTHRFLWCLILFDLGLGLGLLGSSLLGSNLRTSFGMGVGYAFLLVIIELSAGGSGTN